MEGAVRYCHGCSYLGIILAKEKIIFYCDNQAVVDIWKSGSTCASEAMALVCLLYFAAAKHNINVCIVHIDGANNVIADCLSRFKQDRFKQLAQLADQQQTTSLPG